VPDEWKRRLHPFILNLLKDGSPPYPLILNLLKDALLDLCPFNRYAGRQFQGKDAPLS